MSGLPYRNRCEAGQVLARALEAYRGRDDLLILGLPRGGVPVAAEVARELGAPLDILIVRKLGLPGQEELAMGAIASGGRLVLNRDVVDRLGVSREQIEQVATVEREELERRESAYRDHRPPLDVAGRCVVVIDDGLATGSSMLAAVAALRQGNPERIVVAVPVAPPEAVRTFSGQVDEFICPAAPWDFGGVGRWYEDFSQTTDEEVRFLLSEAAERQLSPGGGR